MPQPALSIVKSEPLPFEVLADPHQAKLGPGPAPDSLLTTVGKKALDALPGIGGVVGTALAGPETAGLAAVPAAALGVGVGRGLRDLIAQGLGLDRWSSPAAKAGRIALDTGETAVAQAVLPGLIEAMRTPGQTIGEFLDQSKDLLPDWLQKTLPHLPKGVTKAPSALLQRPAWQTWSEHVDLPAATPKVTALSGQTGTSMTPGPLMVPGPVASTPAAAVSVAPVVAPVAASAASSAPTLAKDMKLTGEETKQLFGFRAKGATLEEALGQIQAMREFQTRFGLTTPTAAETKFPKGMRGRSGPKGDE